MAPVLRPIGRFYAAFYRWSCSAVPASHSSHPLRLYPSCFARQSAGHAYSTTRPPQHLPRPKDVPRTRSNSNPVPKARRRELYTDPTQIGLATRDIMRQVPSTVTVITAYTEDEGIPLPLGSAISSLTTVTLDPLHISFNLKTPSRTLDAMRAAQGRFRAHVLDSSHHSAEIADNFTQGNSLDALHRRNEAFAFTYPVLDSVQQPPKLWYDCVQAIMMCQLEQEVKVGDHVIVVASVKALEAKTQQVPALLYHRGKFRKWNYTGDALYEKEEKDPEVDAAGESEQGEQRRVRAIAEPDVDEDAMAKQERAARAKMKRDVRDKKRREKKEEERQEKQRTREEK